MKIDFPHDKCPEEEGYYLWKNSLGVDLVKVHYVAPYFSFGGMKMGGYFANEYNRWVGHLQGQFSDKLDF